MPRLGTQPGRILFLTFYDPAGISTVLEQVQEWALLSEFEVRAVNLMPTMTTHGMRLPDASALDGVDAVVLHPTVAYFPHNLAALCGDLREKCQGSMPLLVLYKQDEHVRAHETAAIIGESGTDILLTCVSPGDRETVYPRKLTGPVHFEQVYTGYFSEGLLRSAPRVPWPDRNLDCIYRGSKQPAAIGRLGFGKYALARRLRVACERLGLACDASAEWEDRILGFDWIRSLADSRATVSLESGSNCFDFDGSIEREVAAYLESHPELDPWSDPGYAQLHTELLSTHEGNVDYGQIAPRHFEAVAARTPQLLLPGRYSGIFEKDRHYLELDADFGNFEACWERLQDPAARERMLDCAYEEIALDPELQYRSIVRRLDELLIDRLTSTRDHFEPPARWRGEAIAQRIEKSGKPLVLVICPHLAHLDPRIEWWRDETFANARVEVVETSPSVTDVGGAAGGADALLSARVSDVGIEALPVEVHEAVSESEALAVLCQVAEAYRVLAATEPARRGCTDAHLFLLNHMVRNSVGLIEACSRLRGVDGIVVADMPALPAGCVLAELFDVPLLYDAQEVWAHGNNLSWAESRWWTATETRLLARVDFPVTVSPGIGEWFATENGTRMDIVPNFVPFPRSESYTPEAAPRVPDASDRPVRFLFLGNFAPQRGIEELIDAWDLPPETAVLHLQGPGNPLREACMARAREQGKLGNGIEFPEAVDEDELIATARLSDVGLIPYLYPYPLSHCSPNKLGQYMIAGCAIFANRLPFVEACIAEADCGLTANFRSADQIRARLREIVGDRERLGRWRTNARRAARERFNWATAVSGVADRFLAAVADRPTARHGALLEPRRAVAKLAPVAKITPAAKITPVAMEQPRITVRLVARSLANAVTGAPEHLYVLLASRVKGALPASGPVYHVARSVHRVMFAAVRSVRRVRILLGRKSGQSTR